MSEPSKMTLRLINYPSLAAYERAIQDAIDAAVSAERERCAKICEEAEHEVNHKWFADLIREVPNG